METQKLDRLILVCKSNAEYLEMGRDENLCEAASSGTLGNIVVGHTYPGKREGDFWRVWDDLGEDYLYPLYMFEPTVADG